MDGPDANATAPRGTGVDVAGTEPSDGRDRVRYQVACDGGGPYSIQARVLYQPISPRWVDEIAAFEALMIQRLLEYWSAADPRPATLARAERSVSD